MEMKTQVSELCEQFQAALIAYDEGLQSNDVVLAGALWRRFYQQKDVAPEHLDLLIKYIRKHVSAFKVTFEFSNTEEHFFQICILEHVPRDDFITRKPKITWNNKT